MDWLCLLSEHGGEFTWPVSAWAQYCGISDETAREILTELAITKVADVIYQNDNKTITKLSNRRMIRNALNREQIHKVRSEAGKKGMAKRYQKQHSSSSSSSSLNINTVISNDITSESYENSSPNNWAPSMLFVKEFLENGCPPLVQSQLLLDNDWWVDVYDSVNGFDNSFLHREAAKMSAWLQENPKRRPIVKAASYKKFVRGWIQRAKEKERRYGTGPKK